MFMKELAHATSADDPLHERRPIRRGLGGGAVAGEQPLQVLVCGLPLPAPILHRQEEVLVRQEVLRRGEDVLHLLGRALWRTQKSNLGPWATHRELGLDIDISKTIKRIAALAGFLSQGDDACIYDIRDSVLGRFRKRLAEPSEFSEEARDQTCIRKVTCATYPPVPDSGV